MVLIVVVVISFLSSNGINLVITQTLIKKVTKEKKGKDLFLLNLTSLMDELCVINLNFIILSWIN